MGDSSVTCARRRSSEHLSGICFIRGGELFKCNGMGSIDHVMYFEYDVTKYTVTQYTPIYNVMVVVRSSSALQPRHVRQMYSRALAIPQYSSCLLSGGGHSVMGRPMVAPVVGRDIIGMTHSSHHYVSSEFIINHALVHSSVLMYLSRQ